MPADPRGLFDIYKDLIKESIIAYRDAQVAIDPKVTFEVSSDIIHIPELREKTDAEKNPDQLTYVPLACVYYEGSQLGRGSAANKYADETHTYSIDMIVKGIGNENKFSEQIATERLLYLIQQVKNALYRLDNSHFGKALKELGSKTFPTVQTPMTFEDKSENAIVGAKLTFTLQLPYSPPGTTGSGEANANDNRKIEQLLETINVNLTSTGRQAIPLQYTFYVPPEPEPEEP